jgi:hypothetical protein
MSAALSKHAVAHLPRRETAEVIAFGAQELPEPLTAPGSYVGGQFMPVFHRDLRTSEVWRRAPHVAKSVCMDFWMMLWEATPACSVPNDENYIRKALGVADRRTWESVRQWVMQHLVLCRDGRLYHSKQATYATEILARRQQRRGGKSGSVPGALQETPGAPPGGPLETSTEQDNKNNELNAKSAPNVAVIKIDSKEEKTLPSEGAAAPAPVEAAPPAVLTEEDRQRAIRASLGQEWVGIIDRIAPALPPKKREILKNSLVTHYGKGLDGGLQALQALRDVERAALCGRMIGYEACRDDEERSKVVHDYLWAIVKKKPQQANGRPASRQQDLASSFQQEAARRMGAAPRDDGHTGPIIDGEAE